MFSKIFLALVASAISVAAAPSLSLKISGPSAVDGIQNLKLVAIVTNTGTETLKLLNDPRGVLNQSPTHSFTITNVNGTSPAFKGTKASIIVALDSFANAFDAGKICSRNGPEK
jgi:peptidyl-Lys metalloendopeptidase